MTIGVTEEHTVLSEMARRWSRDQAPIAVTRQALEDGSKEPAEVWWGAAGLGLLGMHLTTAAGGAGAGPVELAIAVEELGAGLAVTGFLPTVAVSTVMQLAGAEPQRIAPLADGTAVAAVALDAGDMTAGPAAGGLLVSGRAGPVLGAGGADLLLLAARLEDGTSRWFLLEASRAQIRPLESLDATRPLAHVVLDSVEVSGDDLIDVDDATVQQVCTALAAAEASGVATWCLDTAVEYAKVREQFGRPIGQFQAVKHECAQMLAAAELARAAAWDAARALTDDAQRPLASAVAGAIALDAAVENAKSCIQILGGIGFTWEHDAHLYLRRAVALRQLFGPPARWRAEAARLARQGSRRTMDVGLDDAQAGEFRSAVGAFLAALPEGEEDRRRVLADSGYLQPHWPKPWGRGAGSVEQLVIDQEFAGAGVTRPDMVIGNWILPTLIAHGTTQQQERFVRPSMYGELTWCQMFSEPGAGSDLAALQTKAIRADGGWLLTGQKVWTSLAHRSDWGLCLARTDPAAPKHRGITCFIVDMKSRGLDIRPLRELTGRAMFNEVFLTDVFVPDELVVGEVNDGWRTGRTTLANERVAMSSGSTMGVGVEGLLAAVGKDELDSLIADRVGALVCEGQVLALLGLRTTLRRLGGMDPGPGSSVRKLIGMQHAQACADLLLALLGPAGATAEGPAAAVTHGFLQSRCLTIAGGTTEVQRNVIGERILGLPRDDG